MSWFGANDNGRAITGYTVTASPGGVTATVGADASTAVVPGLNNGTTYTFAVVATNIAGDSIPSVASNSVTPYGKPFAPTGVGATAGNGRATVSWTAANPNGLRVAQYTVTASPGGATATVYPDPGATTLEATVVGLTNGTAYTFSVTASNSAGESEASVPSASVTPGLVATSIELSVTGSRVVGQTLTLEARLTPAEATGLVHFKDGDVVLSTRIAAGVVSIPYTWNAAGDHVLRVSYEPTHDGVGAFLESESEVVAMTIGAPSTTQEVTATGQAFSTSPTVGVSVSAIAGAWSPADVALAYEWRSAARCAGRPRRTHRNRPMPA